MDQPGLCRVCGARLLDRVLFVDILEGRRYKPMVCPSGHIADESSILFHHFIVTPGLYPGTTIYELPKEIITAPSGERV